MTQWASWGTLMPNALRSKPSDDCTSHAGTMPSAMAAPSPV